MAKPSERDGGLRNLDRADLLWALAFFAVALLLRAATLNQAIHVDVASFIRGAQEMLRGSALYRDIATNKPPLVFALTAMSLCVSKGSTLFVGAVVSVLAASVAPALYLAGRRLFGRVGGLAAAFLFTFDPLSMWWGKFMHPDVLLTVFETWTVCLILLLWRRRPFWGVLAGIASGLSAATKHGGLIALPVGLLLLALRFDRRQWHGGNRNGMVWDLAKRIGWFGLGFALPMVGCAVYLWLSRAWGDALHHMWRVHVELSAQSQAYPQYASLGAKLAPMSDLLLHSRFLVALAALAALAPIALIEARRREGLVPAAWLAGVAGFYFLIYYSNAPQYLLEWIPPLCLLAGMTLQVSWDAVNSPRRIVAEREDVCPRLRGAFEKFPLHRQVHLGVKQGALITLALWVAVFYRVRPGFPMQGSTMYDFLEYVLLIAALALFVVYALVGRSYKSQILKYGVCALAAGAVVRILLLCIGLWALAAIAFLYLFPQVARKVHYWCRRGLRNLPPALRTSLRIGAFGGAVIAFTVCVAHLFRLRVTGGGYMATGRDLLEYALVILAAALLPLFLLGSRAQRRAILLYWAPVLTAGLLVRLLLIGVPGLFLAAAAYLLSLVLTQGPTRRLILSCGFVGVGAVVLLVVVFRDYRDWDYRSRFLPQPELRKIAQHVRALPRDAGEKILMVVPELTYLLPEVELLPVTVKGRRKLAPMGLWAMMRPRVHNRAVVEETLAHYRTLPIRYMVIDGNTLRLIRERSENAAVRRYVEGHFSLTKRFSLPAPRDGQIIIMEVRGPYKDARLWRRHPSRHE